MMAHDGYGRAISPVHTPGDGDTIFALATGKFSGEVNYGLVGALVEHLVDVAVGDREDRFEVVDLVAPDHVLVGGHRITP